MGINAVPDRSEVIPSKDVRTASPAWLEYFRSVFYALFGWKRTFTATKNHDFGNIAAGGEETTTVSVPGARQGDLVVVTARTHVAGLGVDGRISANDVATIRRFNFSTSVIDPAADDFRVIVFQQ